MRVVLGGTFDPLHAGHHRLLARALEAAGPDGRLHVGLVSDAYSRAKRGRPVTPYAEREAALRDWLQRRDAEGRVTIRPLDDPHGPSATGDYDAMVASPETVTTAQQINRVRRENGLPPLAVLVVPYALGEDLLPISGTRVRAGLVDPEGRRLRPLRIAVGSQNPVKIDATRRGFARFLPAVPIEVHGVEVASGVPAQPRGAQGATGARNRAVAALDEERAAGAEYGVGIEATLERLADATLDVQHCLIVDATGFQSHGHGPGFAYPPAVARRLVAAATVSDVVGRLADDPEIGRREGAVGWLTRGALDRTTLTEHAVAAALVPRVRRELHDPPPEGA